MLKFFLALLWILLTLTTLAAGLATLAGFLGKLWWLLDLTSHFRAQYFLFLLGSTILFLLGKKTPAALGSGLFALINLALILPLYLATPSAHASGTSYRVLASNLLQRNQSYERVRALIQEINPDFIVLLEINQTWVDELRPVLSDYPHSQMALREDNFGVALFSRFPFEAAQIHVFGLADKPSVVARFDLDGHRLTMIGTHPPPPKSAAGAQRRNRQLAEIAEFVAGHSGAVMVLGDINLTSWSPYFRDLLRASGLRDSRIGFGLQPSWPTTRPWFFIPIDHALVSSEISVHRRQTGPKIGSDHLPVILDFSLER